MDFMVSVIIPAYNAQEHLARAINSALAQTAPPKEIIVVNDGSHDETETIAKSFGDKIIYKTQKNAGAAAARNLGAHCASGDLLAFLDADDVWHQEKLAFHLHAFQKFPDAGICWNHAVFFTESTYDESTPKRQIPPIESHTFTRKNFKEIFSFPHLGTPNVVMKRMLFEELNGFKNFLKTAEDTDLWLRACSKSAAIYIPATLSFVITQENSLSSRNSDTIYMDHLSVVEEFCRQNPEFSQQHPLAVRKSKANAYEKWGSKELCENNFTKAQGKLLHSITLYPKARALYLLAKATALRCKNALGKAT